MHENWLQKYIKEHYREIGFTRLHGPYKYGVDFKGIYARKWTKIEVEWEYSDYITHQHSLEFADVLIVATLRPVPQSLKASLPATIVNIDRKKVIEWAQPQIEEKEKEDFKSYPWRRLSRNLLDLYAYYQKQHQRPLNFVGSNLALSMYQVQKPMGFEFGTDGKERFEGLPEDKVSWDYWLNIAHVVAKHFRLKPAFGRPTWIDRLGYDFNCTGSISDAESRRFKEVALFIDASLLHATT